MRLCFKQLIISSLLLLVGFSVFGQTNQINSLFPSNDVNVTYFALKHKSDYGAGLAMSMIKKGSYLGYGTAIAAIREKGKLNFYDASLSLNGKKAVAIGENTEVYLSLEAGMAVNLSQMNTLYEQSVLSLGISHKFNNNIVFHSGLGVGNNTKWKSDKFFIYSIGFSF